MELDLHARPHSGRFQPGMVRQKAKWDGLGLLHHNFLYARFIVSEVEPLLSVPVFQILGATLSSHSRRSLWFYLPVNIQTLTLVSASHTASVLSQLKEVQCDSPLI